MFNVKNKAKCLISLTLVIALAFSFCAEVYSAGSSTLSENGGYRPYLEYYCDGTTTAGIIRKTLINVYLNEQEKLYLGSSVYDSFLNENDIKQNAVTDSDIVLVHPDGAKQSFDVIYHGAGHINNMEKEIAGPNINETDTDGFEPLVFTAPVSGIYQLRFHSQTGINQNPTPKLTTEQWLQSTSTVGAWNATVVDVEGNVKTGRTFTKCLALNMGKNKNGNTYMRLDSSVYVVTADGYIYQTNFNGMNPYGFIFFANNRGLVSVDSNYSLYKSYVSNNNALSDLDQQGVTYQNPWNDDTDMDKTFNIFFEKPDPELEGILFPTAYEPEVAENLSFVGSHGDNQTHVGYGGYFKFDITNATSATVTIDLTNIELSDGSRADYGIVQLSNPVTPGTNYFYWDGVGGNGITIPAGSYDNSSIKASVETHSGEYHFPLFDVETMLNGIVVTRINKIYKETTDANGNIYNDDVSAKFDDKKAFIYYDNASRQSTINSYKNPAKIIADGLNCVTGVDSSGGAMKFGLSGVDYKGDQTALDIWTYSNNGSPLVAELNMSIIINEDKYASLNGRVFYDNTCSNSDANNNFFDLNDGDRMLSGINMRLEYNYTDVLGVEHTEVKTTTTDSSGHYLFSAIPVMENGNLTNCSITATKPLPSYKVTTMQTTTNSSFTLGKDVQTIDLGGIDGGILNYTPTVSLSDIGYHYTRIAKSITVAKNWVTSVSSDPFRPERVTIKVRSYYFDGVNKIEANHHNYVLNNTNRWSITSTDLPAYIDQMETQQLYYEIVSETYTLRGTGAATYTFVVGDDSSLYPYYTTFESKEIIGSTVLTAVNAPQLGTIQITKRDTDNPDTLLSDVEFVLWEKTALDTISIGEELNYRDVNGDIYHKIQTKKTNENGILTFSGLNVNSYFAIETLPKQGYQANNELYQFDISPLKEHINETIYNTKKNPTITIVKEIDTAINGVSVPVTVMYADNASFQNAVIQNYAVAIEPGQTVYSVCSIEVPSLSFVRVTEGNSQYKINEAQSSVNDTDDGTVVLSSYFNGEVFQVVGGKNYTITLCNNAVLTHTMEVYKVDGNSSIALAQAEFTVYSDAACTDALFSQTTLINEHGNAVASFPDIETGTYYLKETRAPAGYLLPNDAITVVIDAGGTVTANGTPLTVVDNSFSITVANYLSISFPQTGPSISAFAVMMIGLFICFSSVLGTLIYRKTKSSS